MRFSEGHPEISDVESDFVTCAIRSFVATGIGAVAVGAIKHLTSRITKIRGLDFFFGTFSAKVKAGFILIAKGNFHRLLQLYDDFMEVRHK
jgi:hypothetical protein